MNLNTTIPAADEKVIFQTLLNTERGKVRGIRMQTGQEIKTHKSPVPAMLLVLEGSISYFEGDHEQPLLAQDYVLIQPDVQHRVECWKDALCVLVQV